MTGKEAKNSGDDKNATTAIDSAPPTLRTALLRGETVPYLTVPYEVIDNLAVAQGDIVLGTDEDVQRHTAELAEEIAAATAGPGDGLAPGEQALDLSRPAPITPLGNVHTGAGRRWPRGVVPYSIDPSVNADSRAAITQAIDHWHEATRLAFRPRTTTDQDWVLFTHTPGICRSAVGRQGSEQLIEVSECGTSGTIHEIGHAVGLWHEQSRNDRDAFVIIHRENVLPDKRYNFDKTGSDGDDIGPYDFASIMHYSSTEFGITDPDTGRPKTTVEARVALPPGVVMGAATVLSAGDRCAVAAMYPTLNPSPHNTWVGRFHPAAPGHHLLFHSTARRRWFTGTTSGGALSFTDRGSSGDLADGGPLWAGEFTGEGRTGLLAHNPADRSWLFCAARPSDGRMVWSQIGTTSGFGDIATDPFWTGDFTGEGRTSLLFHHPADYNWFLGTCRVVPSENSQCAGLRADISRRENDIRTWEEIRNKLDPREDRKEFKDATERIATFRKEQNDARVLMSQLGCPRLPNPSGVELDWAHVGNTSGFGSVIANPFWTGDFTGEGRTSLLFHYPGDGNWWLGTLRNGQLAWTLVGNTSGFGSVIANPFWTGDFTGEGRTSLLFHYPGDGNWWLGTLRNGQLTWAYVGNTNHLGDMTERQFWTGDFTGDGHTDLLFRNPADHNWFLGTLHQTPAENTLCATLRAAITRHRTEIRTLQSLRDGLDPRLDRDAIRDINAQITAHNQQIASARTEMATLGCPPTPNPGGPQLQWTPVGNTSGFGDINGPYWTGDFTGDGRTDLMFHYAGDLNWWRGTLIANTLTWTLAATW